MKLIPWLCCIAVACTSRSNQPTITGKKTTIRFDSTLVFEARCHDASTILPAYTFAETSDQIQKFTNALHIGGPIVVKGIVLYVKKDIRKDSVIGWNDLYNISVFLKKDGGMVHQLLDGTYKTPTNGVELKQIHTMMKDVMKPSGPCTSILITPTAS